MIKRTLSLFGIAAVVATMPSATAQRSNVIEVSYTGFTVWVDCARRGAVLFHYTVGADEGQNPRHSSYDIDTNVPRECQVTSTDYFQGSVPNGEMAYDVGHMAPANHFDGSPELIRETNYWTNLLPQTASMNRGAWLKTEYIIECLRDETPVEVWGGPIWAGNADDDFFVDSHGIQTPSAYWKVAIRTDTRESNAWIIPNGRAPQSSLDEWLQSVATIEAITGHQFNVADRTNVPLASWTYDAGSGCIS